MAQESQDLQDVQIREQDEKNAAQALLILSVNSSEKKRKKMEVLHSHECKTKKMVTGKKTDCRLCFSKNFCFEHGKTREGSYPRKRDCTTCKPQSQRKNMCVHHKPTCQDKANCMGCLRKDRCMLCSGCSCEVQRLLHECLTCTPNIANWRKKCRVQTCSTPAV